MRVQNRSKQLFVVATMCTCLSITSGLFIAEKMFSFNHTYATVTVRSAIECCLHCEHEASCNSVNFCPIDKTCELNDRSPANFPYSDVVATPNKDLYYISTDPCPEPWILYHRHCYRLVSSEKTWEESVDNCKNMGAYLTDVLDGFENTFVTQICSDAGLRYSWVGLRNYNTTKPQFWTSGRQVNYTYFSFNQPDNHGANFYCIELLITAGGKWDYWGCRAKQSSVCKKRHY